MKSHYPLDFSCQYNLQALFTLRREWQKVNGITLSSFLEIRLSFVEIASWTLVKDEQEGSWLSSSFLCLCQNFWNGFVHVGWTLWLGCAYTPFSFGLEHIWTYKMDINDTYCHGFSSLMDSYCQWILNVVWVLTDTCNGSLGNDL